MYRDNACPEIAESGKQAAAGCLHMRLSQVALTNQAVHCIRAYSVYLVLLHFYIYGLSSLSIVRLLLRRCVRAPKVKCWPHLFTSAFAFT